MIPKRKPLEEALRISEERFRSLTALSSDWYWEQDEQFRLTFMSSHMGEKTGLDPSAYLGRTRWEQPALNLTEADWNRHREQLSRHEAFRDFEIQRTGAGGGTVWLSLSGEPIFDASGRFSGYRGIGREITARKSVEQEMRRSSRMFAALSATNEAIMRATSTEDLYRRVCEAAVNGGELLTTAVIEPRADAASATVVAISGLEPPQLLALQVPLGETSAPEARGLVGSAFRTGAACISNDLASDERSRPWHAYARESGVAAAAAIPLLRDRKVAGVLFFFSTEKRAFDGEIVRLLERMAENVVFGLDNFAKDAQRRGAEERVRYLATHDELTGLPKRALFSQLLNHAIDTSRRYQRSFAVLFVDLDRFKVINDTLGHQAGDQLLQTIAGRLKKTVRASDVVARLGGDEFVVLLQEVASEEQVAAAARKILSAVVRPLEIAGQECEVTASIGVSMYPADATDEHSLMKSADIAMYAAKEKGKNTFQLYAAGMKNIT
jgi:diguanylate cyclase (GGDEF)-like protein/PAS domain S-box-containing protein